MGVLTWVAQSKNGELFFRVFSSKNVFLEFSGAAILTVNHGTLARTQRYQLLGHDRKKRTYIVPGIYTRYNTPGMKYDW